jgi:hypothetical protein
MIDIDAHTVSVIWEGWRLSAVQNIAIGPLRHFAALQQRSLSGA